MKKVIKTTPRVVLGVAAHPDDLDFGASGTFAKFAKEGADCYYLICTNGSKGSDDPEMTEDKLIKIRREEQKDAAKILGLKGVFFLGHPDTQLVADYSLKEEITYYIRKLKPDVVITIDPTFVYSSKFGFINHTDHRAAGQATVDAVFPLARDRLTFPKQLQHGLTAHKTKFLYLISFENPTEIVDISEVVDIKLKALRAHKSQIKETSLEGIKKRLRQLGKEYGFDYGEGFVKLTLPD